MRLSIFASFAVVLTVAAFGVTSIGSVAFRHAPLRVSVVPAPSAPTETVVSAPQVLPVAPAARNTPVQKEERPPPPPTLAPGSEPPDPVEKGSCRLFLSLVCTDSGAPASGEVELWRLDAPGNEHWSKGDQLQVRVDVPKEGKRIDDLPKGRYRVYLKSERVGATDPPAFRVAGPRTEKILSFAERRKFRVRLLVRDASGTLLRRASLTSSSYSSSNEDPPDWVKGRKLRQQGRWFGRASYGIAGVG